MHYGNGHGQGHGNGHGHGGKRVLLIGLLILGGFWLVSDSYRDGYRDAMISNGEAPNARFYRGGPDFPWELVIVGGIGYIAWRKGAFDRLSGPGGPFGPGGNGERGIQRYGGTPGPGQGSGPGFRGPRSLFEEWHREAHEAQRAREMSPAAPRTTPAETAAEMTGNGLAGSGYTPTPPPPPPAPEYWAAMARAAEAAAAGSGHAPTTAPPAPEARPEGPLGATGPTLERG